VSRPEKANISPALAASVGLHAGLAVLVIVLGLYFKKPVTMGGGVPVTLVSEGPPEFSNAPRAAEEQVAQSEVVDETAPPELTPPEPVAPVAPPTPATKAPSTPAGKGPGRRAELDFDRLLKDVQGTPRSPTRPPSGRQGPTQPATAIKVGSGKKLSGATKGYLLTLGDELGRTWRPNCLVEGGSEVKVTVTFTVGPGGTMQVAPRSSVESATSSMTVAASDRAKRAVWAARLRDFPPELYGEELIVPFDASVVCAKR
jgi:outer membrane biosynthesis protein TonB